MIRILFVCLGNICRSPMAEGVMRQRILSDRLPEKWMTEIDVDSAGLGSWHRGKAPDERAILTTRKHGIDISGYRARKIDKSDFESFDYIIAMDRDNVDGLLAICPEDFLDRIHLLMSFAPESRIREVADPYMAPDLAAFDRVFSTIREGVDGLVAHLEASLVPGANGGGSHAADVAKG